MFIIKRNKLRLHTNIDPELKELFDIFKISHNIKYDDALDIGIRVVLEKVCSIDIIKYKKKENEKERERLELMEAKFEDLQRILKEKNKDKLNIEDELELQRSKALKTLLKKPYNTWTAPNRHYAREVGKFKTTEELRKWVLERQ